MRNRLDFSSISNIILDNRKAVGISKVEYYTTLFQYAFEQEELVITVPEDAEISKILNGQRNVAKDIIFLYQSPNGEKELYQSLCEVLKYVSDLPYVSEQVAKLLWEDQSISSEKKQELSLEKENETVFIKDCMLFAIVRNFLPKSKQKEHVTIDLGDYLLDTHLPSVTQHFCGRGAELKEIACRLEKEHFLFLEGIAGIGKSEIVKAYVKQDNKKYNNVLFLHYHSSLRRTIMDMDFIEDTLDMSEEQRFESHFRFFKYLDGNSLVILDNCNAAPSDDDLLQEFISMKFRVLITTRNHVVDMPTYTVKEIESRDALCELFYAYAPSAKENPDIVWKIIQEVFCHTLTVELAAKTLTASGITVQELLQSLKQEGISLSNPNKVVLTKDLQSKRERMFRHIQILFQIQRLSEKNLHILRNMVLMPDKGISKVLFHYWQGKNDFNTVYELVEYGWIQEDIVCNQIALHPFLQEVLLKETIPSIISCADILMGIFNNCICYGMEVPYYNELLNTIESIYKNIQIDDIPSAILFMDTTMSYLAKYERTEAIRRVLDLFSGLEGFGEDKRRIGIYDCYAGYVEYLESNYQKSAEWYLHGLEALKPFHPVYAALASNLLNNLGMAYMAMGNMDEAFITVKRAIQIRKENGMEKSHDDWVQGLTYAQILAAKGELKEARKQLFGLIRMVKKQKDMQLYLANIYLTLAAVEGKQWPEDSAQHYKRAKEAMLAAHLPETHPDVVFVAQKAIEMEVLARGVRSGKIQLISRKDL